MQLLITGLTAPVALAVVALIGYLVGRTQRRQMVNIAIVNQKLARANSLILKAELISDQLRQSMAAHHSTLKQCREQFLKSSDGHSREFNPSQHSHLQTLLAPAEELSDDIACAYDELRQQSRALARLRAW